MKTLAFIGVGNMGNPMAGNLVKAGFEVRVHDIVPELIQKATELGCHPTKSLEECVNSVDAVVSMLPSGEAVQDLYYASGKLLEFAPKTALLIDCSTIASDAAKEVHEKSSTLGFEMIDAPVSGGTAGAAQASLTFMVGGTEAALERARPILSAMGKNIFHAGTAGAGQVAKMCNNMLLAIHMIGTSEAIELGRANGIDPAKLCEIMKQSSGKNWSLELYNPLPGIMEGVPSSRDYQGGFAVDLMLKDLSLANDSALKKKSSIPLGSLARDLYAIQSKTGKGRLDFSSIIQLLQNS